MGKIWNEVESYSREMGLDSKLDYSGGDNPIYIGRCFPGAATSDAKWQIYKNAYNADGNPTDLRWANGTDVFDKVWDDRSSYTYLGI